MAKELTVSPPLDPPRGTEQSDSSPLVARSLDQIRQAAALLLWHYDVVQVRPDDPFRLASGNMSPLYVNCRRPISEPAFMELYAATARLVCEHEGVVIDAVAGGETAGIPYAAYLASALGKPMVYVRKKPKGYGLASCVEGHLKAGSTVLLVEDLITDGGSKLGFLDALADAGGTVRDVLVLFDRQQGGAETLARRGARLHAVTDLQTALRAGEAAAVLSPEAKITVEDYFRDPEAWHRARGFEFTS